LDFDEIYRRHYASLFRYMCRLTGDVDAAEDAAQEAFLSLLRRGPKVEQLNMPPTRPDELTERREMIDRVRAVLDRLPERDRKILLLREEGFSYKEIAATIEVAASSVGTLIARALRRFAAEYKVTNEIDAPS